MAIRYGISNQFGAFQYNYNTPNTATYDADGFGVLRYIDSSSQVLYSKTDLSLSGNLYVNSINIGRGGGFVATNTAIGTDALLSNTNGINNEAFGYQSLRANTSGSYNVAYGYQSLLSNNSGSFNLAVGNDTLRTNTAGGLNVALGHSSGFYTTGSANTSVGVAALEGGVGSFSGSNNTGVGVNCLKSLTTGSNNTGLGGDAGFAGTAITTGSNNTFLGFQAQATNNSISNSTAIGVGAVVTASNQIMLGRSSEKVYICGQTSHPLPYIVASGSTVLTATNGSGRVQLSGTYSVPSGYSYLVVVVSNGDMAANANTSLTGGCTTGSPSQVWFHFNNATAGSFRANYIIYAIP